MDSLKEVGVNVGPGPRTNADTMESSPMSRRKKVKKNEAFLLSGPPTLALKNSVWYPGTCWAKGLRVLRGEALILPMIWPWNLLEPGRVVISMRPYPTLSYSAEKGFWLMRISRMSALGGNWPAVNPST